MTDTARSETREDEDAPRRAVLVFSACFSQLGHDDSMALSLDGDVDTVELERSRGAAKAPMRISLQIERPQRGELRLRLPDPYVSTHHATVARAGDDHVAIDRGSSHGVFINGERIREPRPLRDGDALEIGTCLFVYRRVPAPARERLFASSEEPVVSACAEVLALAADLRRIASSDLSVMLLGERGVGKSWLAEQLHAWSGRTPFVAVNCGGIPSSLAESYLFGHVRGAFSGAAEDRKGAIERAHGGTLFLDEIGTLPPAAQAALLRVIEDRRVERVGGTHAREVDVRWIAATNADLASLRPDLVDRLTSFSTRLPPLRERREDLGRLAVAALGSGADRVTSLSLHAARHVMRNDWAGNVRELQGAIRRGVTLAAGTRVELAHLTSAPVRVDEPQPRAGDASTPSAATGDVALPLAGSQPQVDPASLARMLRDAGGNRQTVAQWLGVDSRQVRRWITRWGLERGEP